MHGRKFVEVTRGFFVEPVLSEVERLSLPAFGGNDQLCIKASWPQ